MGFLSMIKGGFVSAGGSEQTAADVENAMGVAGSAVGMDNNESCCPKVSYETRLKGFFGCFISGWLLSFCSVIAISLGNISGFVLLYSLGNIVALLSTLFLMGPWKQLKNMFSSGRIFATLIFLGMIAVTIVVAFKTKNVGAVVGCVLLQLMAGLWYTLSYIPFARQMVINLCSSGAGLG